MNQADLRTLLKKQAILDIIVVPEREEWRRLVTYAYDQDRQVELFKIDPGTGDHLMLLFSRDGVLIKGFDHASCLSPYLNEDHGEQEIAARIYADVPAELTALLDEELLPQEVTFCKWQRAGERQWHKSKLEVIDACISQEAEDGGESRLLGYVFSNAEDWFDWAAIFYELAEEAWDAAERLYDDEDLTRSMVTDLNPDRDYDTVLDECYVRGLLEDPDA